MSKVRLDRFNYKLVKRERGRLWEMTWLITQAIFFDTSIPWPYFLKRFLLRRFGAKIGKGVVLRTRIYIHSPWHLSIGDHCWVGDGCQLLTTARITFEDHVALAHEVYVAAGGHDIQSATMAPDNQPILIKSGCWITSRAFIGPGVTIEEDVVVAGGAVVVKDVEASIVVGGNPAKKIADRVINRP